MTLSQAKPGRERPRKGEKKNYRSDKFLPNPEQRIAKKFKKLKNIILASFQAKTGWERPRKREKKLSIRPITTRLGLQNSKKNSKKVQKIKKHDYGYFSSQNGTGLAEKERKKKIIVPISSYPTRNREFQKNSKKIQKYKKHHYNLF